MWRSTSPRVVANRYRAPVSDSPAKIGSWPRGTIWTSSPTSSVVTAPWPRALHCTPRSSRPTIPAVTASAARTPRLTTLAPAGTRARPGAGRRKRPALHDAIGNVAPAQPHRGRVHHLLGPVIEDSVQPLAAPLDPGQDKRRVVHLDRNADARLDEVSLGVFRQVPPQVGQNAWMRYLNPLIIPVAVDVDAQVREFPAGRQGSQFRTPRSRS